jgi:integrase
MAVFKRLTCSVCASRTHAEKEVRVAPRCVKCGGATSYSDMWYVSITVPTTTGRQKKILRAVSPKKGDAVAEEGRLLAERKGGVVHAINDLTVSKTCDLFLAWCQMRVDEGKMAPLTLRYYTQRTNTHVRKAFGKMKLADFAKGAELLVDAYKARRMKDVAPATVNRELATLKKLVAWAAQKKLIASNVLSGYELLTENNRRERVLTPEEYQRLLDNCPSAHCRLACIIAWNTGLRLEGVLTLKWAEIDRDRNEIVKVVKHQRRAGPKAVRIPITPTLAAELKAWKDSQRVLSQYVIPSPRNRHSHILITSDFGFQKAAKAAKLSDLTFHDLRHCFATYFLMRTKNLNALAAILGHSPAEQYRMSLRYAHILSEEKHEAMRQFAGES